MYFSSQLCAGRVNMGKSLSDLKALALNDVPSRLHLNIDFMFPALVSSAGNFPVYILSRTRLNLIFNKHIFTDFVKF